MSVFALSDPHLSFAVPGKSMEVFGPLWENYTEKIKDNWRSSICDDDLVLIPGDISWAMHLEQALPDLNWIDSLPGTKVILKGNHDFWWPSSVKLQKSLPPTIRFVYNNTFNWKHFTIGGTRLWDTDEYHFRDYIHFRENKRAKEKSPAFDPALQKEADRKIFERELQRLRLSLEQLDPTAKIRIAMTHYPPISADLRASLTSSILEEYKIDVCVFGHLHSLKREPKMFGEIRGVRYILTSCDYIDFNPVKII